MNEEQYYREIQNLVENYEVNTRVRILQDNRDRLRTNWEIGKIIVEAQGGRKRAKYGDELIKKWSLKLEKVYGRKYSERELRKIRQFFLIFPFWPTVSAKMSWSHIVEIISIKNENERTYYINQVILNQLSVRELRSLIKSKAYDRLSYADKENIQLIDSNNTSLTIEDMIKDPILIKTDKKIDHLDEKALHQYIISMLETRFLELGVGFALIGHEYKIKVDHHLFKIDLLFFNIELNNYVVVELKTSECNSRDVGQLEHYVYLVDQKLKKQSHNKTIGLLIVKKKDKYVIEYTTNKDIFITTYQFVDNNKKLSIN